MNFVYAETRDTPSPEEQAKKQITHRISEFNYNLQQESESEYRILLDFMKAIEEEEITFFLQPQCRISNGKFVGVEALARWIKPDGTLIPPLKFVPVLEKYGLVTVLDEYVWERVCRSLRRWLDRGHKAVPVSVNVSRVDIYTIDIAKTFETLCAKYNLPHQYLKIEITESAYSEDTDLVASLIQKLRSDGFMVLMDDFGAGYSSLNMLGTISVDAIKLDGLFLNFSETNREKGIHIIESIINMAKTISTPVIIEGVETQEQVDFLASLGCQYVQGFFYYKPMPAEEFENILLSSDRIDERGLVLKVNEQFRLREFLDENIYSDAMLNNILGAVGVYTWKDEEVNIVRFNQQFYSAVDVPDFHSRLMSISRFVPPQDKPKLIALMKKAKENRLNGASEIIHFYKTDGTLTTFLMKMYFLAEQADGYTRFYGSVRNITSFTDLQDKLSLLSSNIQSSIVIMKRRENAWSHEEVAHGLETTLGLSKKELEEELNNRRFFNRFLDAGAKNAVAIVLSALEANTDFSVNANIITASGGSTSLVVDGKLMKEKAGNIDYVITLGKRQG